MQQPFVLTAEIWNQIQHDVAKVLKLDACFAWWRAKKNLRWENNNHRQLEI